MPSPSPAGPSAVFPAPTPAPGPATPPAPPPAELSPPRAPEPAPQVGFRPRVDRTFREQVEDAEREIILYTLAHTQDNVTEAARLLDLERGHFYKKMKALGLRRSAADKEPAQGPSGE